MTPRHSWMLQLFVAFSLILSVGAGTSARADDDGPYCAGLNVQGLKQSFVDELDVMVQDGIATNIYELQVALREEGACHVELRRPNRRRRSGSDMYRKCRESVVMVGKLFKCGKCDKWHASVASGFVIHKDGVIVTN